MGKSLFSTIGNSIRSMFSGRPEDSTGAEAVSAANSADAMLTTQASTASSPGRLIVPEAEHGIKRQRLDDNALKVVYRLVDSGYEGYLVGGCIRDLLMGKRPKDFDVTTDAEPEQAHELFRRSRLIGRRFKLLHVRFGRELIEVATFRAGHDSSSENNDGELGKQSESGLILRDNVYGTIEDDARRRDFTVNALYYCIKDHSVHDFTGGYQDLQQRVLRMIGDPEARYREDPVRMLRAARFAAKLDFDIEPGTEAPIRELAPLLGHIAAARLFDEVLKLFQSGHAMNSYKQLQKYDLFRQLFAQTQNTIEQAPELPVEALISAAFRNTDRRLNQRKSVTPSFLFAALLWYPTQRRMQQLIDEQGMPAVPALHEAANEVIGLQVKSTAIPRRFSTPIREIWELQLRLPRRHGKRAERLMEHPRFRAAYDLLLLREQAGEDLDGLGRWWTDYQNANGDQRSSLEQQQGRGNDGERRKPRRRRRSNNKTRSGDNES